MRLYTPRPRGESTYLVSLRGEQRLTDECIRYLPFLTRHAGRRRETGIRTRIS